MNAPLELSSITITNLRSIRHEIFPLNKFTPLIGYNNAGKTNILKAIHWLLSRSSLDISYFNDPNAPIEVEGYFRGISPEVLQRIDSDDAEALRPFLIRDSIHVKRVQRIPGEAPLRIEFLVYYKDPKAHHDKKGHWIKPPPATEAAFSKIFPQPIRLWDFNGENFISKLLVEIFKPLERRFENELGSVLKIFSELLSAGSDTRAEELNSFDKKINEKLEPLFPNMNIHLDLPMPTLVTFLKEANLLVRDEEDGFERDIQNMGAGAKRAIQMALIRYLAEVKKHHHNHYNSRRLFLIDSPELFLHPQAVELVRVALRKLSEQGYQIIFATHSAQMVTSEDVKTALLIRKNKERGTFMRKRMEDAVHQVLEDAPSQVQMLFSLSNSNELLFADYVLLTEGKTEWRILPTLFEQLTGLSFALIKCALVRQGGVSNTRKSMKVLRAMDMPVRAIVDLDYAFNNAANDGFLERKDPDIEFCKNLFKSLAFQEKIRLVNGVPVSRHSRISASEAYALMARQPEAAQALRNIHAKLRSRGIWVWTRGAIEEHLGLQGKNEKVWSDFIQRIHGNANLEKNLPDFQGIRELCDWIIEGSEHRK